MEIAKIVGISITCAIVVICVKNVNPELASIVTVCAGVLILSLAVNRIDPLLKNHQKEGEPLWIQPLPHCVSWP